MDFHGNRRYFRRVIKKKEDRLEELESKLARKKRRGSKLYWLTYNPGAEFDYDVSDADEDIRWMIHEIRRLRDENREYREFIENYRKEMERELGLNKD
jgi:hypothetical protein